MNLPTEPDTVAQIVERARELGASLAGIATVADLRNSRSYQVYDQASYYQDYEGVEWPADARSVLALALVHAPSEPELDWWDYQPGRTHGNRRLMSIAQSLKQWLEDELGIIARPLPYRVEQGGVLLKDAAALAGLGVIGKNNLLITPEFGPRVRLRALFLDAELEPTGPIDFSPCDGCDMPCWRACPRVAFGSGTYSRALCDLQMKEDEANEVVIQGWLDEGSPGRVRKYCRACELACPIAG